MENSYPTFSLAGITAKAKVVKVYDGDTIKVVFNPFPKDPNSKEWKFRIRFLGCDTNELKPKKSDYPDEKERQEIIKLAKMARDDLDSKIMGKDITIECSEFDAFGRILCNVYINDFCLNEYMKKYNKNLTKY